MAGQSETIGGVLELALGAAMPARAMILAERCLLARRTAPPDVPAAVRHALAQVLGTVAAPSAMARTALAIGEAVERHGAAFPPGGEPAYHDRHHQAETVLAMGWLAGAARRLGLLTTGQAELAIAAMAGHDLLHDGQVPPARGALELRSADAAAEIGAREGLDTEALAALRRTILATTWPWREEEAPDLVCRLAREADLFGSTMPELGPRLSRQLAIELAAAGQPAAESVAGHAARVALLRALPPASLPARAIGLETLRAAQIEAYAGVARRLGIAPPSAEAGAAALDAMDPADAQALLAWGGTA